MARKLKRAERLAESAPYELLVHLASGGMGSVYIGAPRKFGAGGLVAIKRAHPHLLEDATFRKMFVSEAKLAMRLATPHVVGVREVDESDGELLLVMEYVEGGSLAELLSSARRLEVAIAPAVVLRIVIDAALGLQQAHALVDARNQPIGMVHRDVSPQNILCGIDGRGRVVDFGVAKAVDHEGSHTESGVFKGKVAYMAPEYLRDRVVTPLIDVFALGVVAWEGVMGRRLFRGQSELETVQMILSDDPCPPIVGVPGIPPAVARTIATALAKNPARRWRSAAEFAAALESSGVAATRAELAKTVATLLASDLAERRTLLREGLKRAASGTVQLNGGFGLPVPTAAPETVPTEADAVALTPPPASAGDPTAVAPPRAPHGEGGTGSAAVSMSQTREGDAAAATVPGRSRRWVGASLGAAAVAGVLAAVLVVRGLDVRASAGGVASGGGLGAGAPTSVRADGAAAGNVTPTETARATVATASVTATSTATATATGMATATATATATAMASVTATSTATATATGMATGMATATAMATGGPPRPVAAPPPRWVPKDDPYAKKAGAP